MGMEKLLLISYDAVGDDVFNTLVKYPHFAQLAESASVVRGVSSVFLSNTYPVHTSVVTGVTPDVHGLISNTEPFPLRHPRWCCAASLIRRKTLWQAAHAKNLSVASVLWPVTAAASEIRYNIPEVMAMPGEKQLAVSLAAGSKWTQIKAFLRHRRLLDGIKQPALDRFSAACMADILREHHPALALIHFTAYDSLCHRRGLATDQLTDALETLDEGLGKILQAAGPETGVILFSDHAQLPAANHLLPNVLLLKAGHMQTNAQGDYLRGDCFFECCGGAAFLHPGGLTAAQQAKLAEQVLQTEGVARLLTEAEMQTCGRPFLSYGFAAKPGSAFAAYPGYEAANHGYPVDYAHYDVFYLASGSAFARGKRLNGGSLLDIAPLAAHALQLDMPGLQPPRADMLN